MTARSFSAFLPKNGYRIVLTASRPEMSQFGPEVGRPADSFRAFRCTFPHRLMRPFVARYFASLDFPDGRVRVAPYGLRKVEAALADRFGPEQVAVAHPDRLEGLIGPATEMVGITTMDPLGMAYVSATYDSLVGVGGESVNAREFRLLLKKIRGLRNRRRFRVAVGGEAVWQIIEANVQGKLGIDHLVIGRAEAELGGAMEAMLSGEAPAVIRLPPPPDAETSVPLIRAPAIYGDAEITRGCGRGCAFCSPNLQRRASVPLPDILEEVRVNIRGGGRSVFVVSDDIFLYRCGPAFAPNTDALIGLFEALAAEPGIEHIHLSHASLAPVLADPRLVSGLAPILVRKSARRLGGDPYATVEVGIESGSAAIMRRHMPGKALPLDAADWPEIVSSAISELNARRIFPLGTIGLGWPDETCGDAEDTLKLIQRLRRERAKVFATPVVFVPLDRTPLGRSPRIDLRDLDPIHLRTIQECWEHNLSVWGSRINPWALRLVGLAAKGIALGRSLRGSATAGISHGFADSLLRRRLPCQPGLCDPGKASRSG